MQTLDEWKAILTTDLLALRRLQGGDALSRMRHAMKEQAWLLFMIPPDAACRSRPRQ